MDGAMIEWIIYLLFLLFRDCWCLKLTGITVPRYKIEGEDAVLECHYELPEEKSLYAVKWYKMDEEFYRYVLRSNPPMTSYPVEGINVDTGKSDRRRVALRHVTPLSSGVYRCEVSAEAPSFSSGTAAARMTVQHIPERGPQITGEEKVYSVGDELILNCTSAVSYPPTVLHWYINDLQIENEDQGLVRYQDQRTEGGLIISKLGLGIQLMRFHFRKGRAQLKCVAVYPFGGEYPEGEALTAGGQTKATKPSNQWEAVLLITLNESSSLTSTSCLLLTALAAFTTMLQM